MLYFDMLNTLCNHNKIQFYFLSIIHFVLILFRYLFFKSKFVRKSQTENILEESIK